MTAVGEVASVRTSKKVPAAVLVSQPSLIDYKFARFLITDAPTDNNINLYIQEFVKHNIVVVVRTCDPSYSGLALKQAGIMLEELAFPDGAAPTDDVITKWLAIVHKTFAKKDGKSAIAIHCVAGLGRAPVLVGVALIELGMDNLDAVQFIRERRPKAFNHKQINYLETYKRRSKRPCIIM